MDNLQLTEEELDMKENRARMPGEAARTDLLMAAVLGAAAVVGILILMFLYRAFF